MSCVFVLPRPPQSPQVTPSEVSVAESEFKRKMKLFHVCCSSFCTKGGCCWCKCSPPIMNGNIYQNQHLFADNLLTLTTSLRFHCWAHQHFGWQFLRKKLGEWKKTFLQSTVWLIPQRRVRVCVRKADEGCSCVWVASVSCLDEAIDPEEVVVVNKEQVIETMQG